ncbi:MAG: hypothetical protein RIQ33_323 [Bacteroidota bacterium]
MKKIYIYLFLFIGVYFSASAQSYWQQDVQYKIDVKLDDVNHYLQGNIQIKYTNNSPQSLSYIYFHLWPNAYKDNSTELVKQQINMGTTDLYFADEIDRGFIDKLNFMVDGKPGRFLINDDTIDIGKLLLDKPLQPNQSITIETPFRVKIPKTFSRLGHEEQQYQISQWYPKPAVFDKNGWNQMPYLDQGEFYSEYGSFDVHITLPKNYVVGATGDLQTEDEKKFMDSLAARTASYDGFIFSNKYPTSNDTFKTLHYTAQHVHDFAWFTDKRYVALKGNVALPSGRNVATWLLFTPRSGKYWKDALPYINHSVAYYSKWIGEYPYNSVTAVEGKLEAGGGMEYPMITVIGKVSSKSILETVIVHEVGHNWFQGILGNNERLHPWMDEGINSYFENRYTRDVSSLNKSSVKKSKGISFAIGGAKDKNGNTLSYLGYAFSAYKNEDQPCELPATQYSTLNYFGDVYAKTPLVFNYLANTIGEAEFDSIMHIYFNDWKFKHPTPDDIKKIFNNNTKQNIDWFWNDAINSTKKFDLQLKNINRKVEKIGTSAFYKVTIKNKGNIRTPYSISGISHDSILTTINYGGFLGEMEVLFPVGNYSHLRIDAAHYIPELNRQNNTCRIDGKQRKIEPLKITTTGVLKTPNEYQLNISPIIGYNIYNGLMPGLFLANPFLPGNKIVYQLVPMLGLKQKDFAFTGKIASNWNVNSSFIHHIQAGIGLNAFDSRTVITAQKYVRIKPFIEFRITQHENKNNVTEKFIIESNIIKSDAATEFTPINFSKRPTQKYFVGTYEYNNTEKIAPQKFIAQIQNRNNDYKLTATFETGLMYKKNKYFKIRGFGGFVKNQNPAFGFKLYMSGVRGNEDYLYNNMYFGRDESAGFWAKQLYIQEGGFRQVTWQQNNIGSSNLLLGSLNFTFDLPIGLPVAVYADLGMYGLKQPYEYQYDKLQYDAGLVLHFTKNFQINFPLLASQDFKNNVTSLYGTESKFKQYVHRITFVFNINAMNPISATENFKVK